MGLIAVGDLDTAAVQNGLQYLLDTQNADGSWSEDEITGTGFPKVFYLKYDMYRNNFPLLALATYENARNGVFRPGHMQLQPVARKKLLPEAQEARAAVGDGVCRSVQCRRWPDVLRLFPAVVTALCRCVGCRRPSGHGDRAP